MSSPAGRGGALAGGFGGGGGPRVALAALRTRDPRRPRARQGLSRDCRRIQGGSPVWVAGCCPKKSATGTANSRGSSRIEGWNDPCHPFTWTKTADEIGHTPSVNGI